MSDCDTTKDADGVREQPRSTYKRRSSIFLPTKSAQRIEEAETSSTDHDESDTREENYKPNQSDADLDENFDLSGYIKKLQNERKEWKETLNARKSKRRILQKQRAIAGIRGVDFDLSVLSESEKAFLLDRPNYQQISRNIKKLTDAAVKVATLNREIEYLKDRLTLKIEQKLRNVTKKVIEMSSEN